MKKIIPILFAAGALLMARPSRAQSPAPVLLKNVTLIDGTGAAPGQHMDLLIQGDTIAAVGGHLSARSARVIDGKGKTVMPALISAHTHVGTLKGTTTNGSNYTRENILRQLQRYQDYGVGNILVMGTDRPLIFNGFRDSSVAGLLPGARLHSAGYGFGVPGSAPPANMGMDKVFRPASVDEVQKDVEELQGLHPTVAKIWVDDFGGQFPKMQPAIYQEIIKWSHNYHIRVAAHLYYLADAKQLVADGVDIIAHSIRDKDIDDTLLQEMRTKHIAYIPTLSLDEFAYIYARKPEWIDDAFFKAALEPGVYEMITSKDYQEKLRTAPDYNKKIIAFETALRNLKKIFDAGILVALGTDSGATPVRAQGFSEHLELELMVQAGLSPLQAITVATGNAAKVLQIDDKYGTLEKGKIADFIVLAADPLANIRNTRKIVSVWKAGRLVSHGPLAK